MGQATLALGVFKVVINKAVVMSYELLALQGALIFMGAWWLYLGPPLNYC